MSTRPNEAQELYEAYASSDENYDDDYAYGYGYDGDDDAYEDWPEDDGCIDLDMCDYGTNPAKDAHRHRRRSKALAKRRFLETAAVATKNLRARLSHADRYPNAPIYKYRVAKRLRVTAEKMGMDI